MEFEEEEVTDLLETNRFEIVRRLQVDRTFLFDYLRSKNVFDIGDCDLVYAEKTRELRAGKFLDILMMKGKAAYDHFIDALQLLNPGLFEKLTGQKATCRPNPIMMDMKENFTLGNGSTTMDLDIMSSHLKRTIQDLQDMTLRYDQVLKTNHELTKNLQEALFDLQGKNNRLELLEKQIQDGEARLLEAHTTAQRAQDSFGQKISIERERINENNTFIIALQMRLLEYKEQIDGLEKQKSELISQNDCLKGKLSEICKHYENERRQSMRLTERLETQKSDIERVQETKRKYRELMFQNQQILKERDDIAEELEQLKNWTEALKVRYDIVKQEKDETLESHETVVADCSNLRDQSYRLELTINQAKRREEDLSKVNKDLEEAVKSYRKQRDLCEQAMKEAIMERDQARNERDECQQRHKEVVNLRDTKISEHMEETKKFEALFEEARKELRRLKERLQEAENDKQILLVRVMTIESTKQSHPASTVSSSKQDNEDGTPGTPITPCCNKTFNWKDRKTRDVIDSVKKRMQTGSNAVYKSPSSSMESNRSSLSLERETSLDEKLAAIIPQYDNLSAEAKKNLSLQRNQPVKMLLPYGAIATMCPSLVNSSGTTYETGRQQTSSAVTPFLSGNHSGGSGSVPRAPDFAEESDENQNGLYVTPETCNNYVTPDAVQPETHSRSPYRRSLSSPPSTMFKVTSTSPVDYEPEGCDKKNGEADEEKMWKNTEADQQLAVTNIRRHQKLCKRGPEKQKVTKDGHSPLGKRESYHSRESNLAFNVLVPSETESFSFDEEVVVRRSICNESEESLREVRDALQSPSLRSPFRDRAKRLSPDERPRSKSTGS